MSAVDTFKAIGDLASPANDVAVVTPNDSTDLAFVTRFIRSQGAGAIKVTTKLGSQVVLQFAAGETRALRVSRIWATGTTVSGQIEAMV